MGLFEHFPYTNYHDANLDWIIKKMNEFVTYLEEKDAEWQQMETDFGQMQTDFAAIEDRWTELQTEINSAIEGIAPAIADGLREAQAAMQAQYDAFIEAYQQTWNIVQVRGQSTTDVMSQKAVSDVFADFELRKFDASNVKQTTGTAENQVMSQKAVTDQLALKLDASAVKQVTGTSTTDVMSQKATTDALDAKLPSSYVKQTTGSNTDFVMSQAAVSDALELKLNTNAVKQATGSNTGYVMSQKATTDALALKFDKASIRQSTGAGEDLVMSQKAVTEALALKGDASDVGTLQTQMAAVLVAVASKASQDSLDALATIVGALSNNAVEVYPTAVTPGAIPWTGVHFTSMPANKYYTFANSITDQDVAWLPAYGYTCTIIRFAAYAMAYQNGKLYYCASVQDPLWIQIATASDVALKLDKTAVKQTTGTSTTDVMSQKALTDIIKTTMVYNPTEITADNYQDEGISDVSDIEYNYLTRFDSTITALMVTGLPVYGADVSVMKYADADSGGDPITVCYIAYSGADCYQSADGATWKKAVFQGDAPMPVIIDCTSGSLPSGWTYAAIDAIINTRPVLILWNQSANKPIIALASKSPVSGDTYIRACYTRFASSASTEYYCRINDDNSITIGNLSNNNTIANPALAGTEATLEGLQVGVTKYSNKLYQHVIMITRHSSDPTPVTLLVVYITIYNKSATPIETKDAILAAINNDRIGASGYINDNTLKGAVHSIRLTGGLVYANYWTGSGSYGASIDFTDATVVDNVMAI